MSNILVTGAAGFIGSFLTEALISEGHHVTGVDNFFRGKRENLASLKNNAAFELIEMDLSKPDCVLPIHQILNSKKIDTVYHLAAVNGTQHFYDHSAFVLDQNTVITKNVMEAIENSPVKKIIYTSSSEVYGEPMIVPTPETHPVLLNAKADRDSYAASKAMGDFYVRLVANKIKIDWLVLRVFNMYGPRMVNTKYGQVIPEFIQRTRSGEAFTVIGDGHHTRSFCFIHDAIRLIIMLEKQKATGFINLGNPEEISILNLAKKIHEIAGKAFKPVFLAERAHDHHRRCPDISTLLSYVPNPKFTALSDGLLSIITPLC
ncbi:MAG: NAD-dependent epimerase/dehydratase family protein [Gammaproteobacteria bacterium]|nr:NAD-dependent epimerase/dehydratase family protein [Gammaproteobacteria bacterium]